MKDKIILRCEILALFSVLFISSGCSNDQTMGDFDVPLVSGYYLVQESEDATEILHIHDMNRPGIRAKVVEVAFNEHYILAKQQELKPRGSFAGDDFQVPVPGKFNFWILEIDRTNRLGPMSEEAFKAELKSLNLEELKLTDTANIKEFKKR